MIAYRSALVKFKKIPLDLDEYDSEAYWDIGWDARPQLAEFVYHGDAKSTQYFGVELEFASELDVMSLAQAVYPFGKAYFDQTPASEVITSPATFNATKMILKRFYRRFAGLTESSPQRSYRGNHVHFSTKNLDKTVLDNIFRFFSSPDNREFTELVAERRENESCARTNSRQDTYSKHTAVNTETDYATWEIRIFRAPNTVKGALKNLEFVHAGIEFSKEETDARNFIPWLKHNCRGHENLVTFLKAQGAY